MCLFILENFGFFLLDILVRFGVLSCGVLLTSNLIFNFLSELIVLRNDSFSSLLRNADISFAFSKIFLKRLKKINPKLKII